MYSLIITAWPELMKKFQILSTSSYLMCLVMFEPGIFLFALPKKSYGMHLHTSYLRDPDLTPSMFGFLIRGEQGNPTLLE